MQNIYDEYIKMKCRLSVTWIIKEHYIVQLKSQKIKDKNSHIFRVAKIGDNEKSDIVSECIISSNTPTYQWR